MPTTTTGKATDFIQFSRASSATVVDSDGKIKWAPHNLLTNSESFDASAWGKYLTTVAANTQVAPNGTTTADTVTASAGNDVHRVQRASGETTTASTNYSLSVFVKAGTHNFVTVGFFSASEVFVAATFNMASGSAATETDVGTTSGTVVSTEKVDVGSGWFRLSITGNYNGTSALAFISFAQAATGNSYSNFGQPVVNLAGTETFHLWGAHLYRSDLGGMQANTSAYPMYNPTTPKNLLGFSEDFSNAAWVLTTSVVTPNSITSPNGLNTADKITPDNGSSNGSIRQTVSGLVSGAKLTASVYVKGTGVNWFELAATSVSGTSPARVWFNISSGTVGTNNGGFTAPSITSVGDGWYRVSATFVTAATSTNFYCIPANADNVDLFTGNGTSGIYLWGAQLSDSASLDTYVPSYGAAPTAAAYYGPRRDFDAVTLACKGLLVEEQRTNLLLRSAEFNLTWASLNILAFGSGSVVDATTAPSGSVTAELITPDTTNGIHRINQSVTGLSSSAPYTATLYVKPNGYTKIGLAENAVTGAYVAFDCTGSGSVLASGSGGSGSIVSVGSGWYRLSLTVTTQAAQTTYRLDAVVLPASYTTGTIGGSWVPDGTSGIYIWGAQLEAGSFATSYIPTGSATATRSADVVSVSTQAFPYDQAKGTLVAYATTFASSGDRAIVALSGSGVNHWQQFYNGGSNANFNITSGGSITTNPLVAGTIKLAGTYADNDAAASRDGQTAVADTTVTVSSGVTSMTLGSLTSSTFLNGHIRQITYIPRRLTNAELQSRTA